MRRTDTASFTASRWAIPTMPHIRRLPCARDRVKLELRQSRIALDLVLPARGSAVLLFAPMVILGLFVTDREATFEEQMSSGGGREGVGMAGVDREHGDQRVKERPPAGMDVDGEDENSAWSDDAVASLQDHMG